MVRKTNTVSKIHEVDTTALRDKSRLIHMQNQLPTFEDWAEELQFEDANLLREALSESTSLVEKFMEKFE